MKKRKRIYAQLLIPLAALLLYGMIILEERKGVSLEETQAAAVQYTELKFTDDVEIHQERCLLLTADDPTTGTVFLDMMSMVLDDMAIPYDTVDVSDARFLTILPNYSTAVITFGNWQLLGENLLKLCDWVRDGGRLMNTSTPEANVGFSTISPKLGIEIGGTEYAGITGLRVEPGCMIGANDGISFNLSDKPVEISLNLTLRKSCFCPVFSEDGTVPLLWSCDYGKGRFSVINVNMTDKFQRGFFCLAYSLLEDACIYPVINGSCFYLDDFPSPIPQGDSTYISRDYGISTAHFYANIWWPKLLNWMDEYGIRYTGVVIEDYNDKVQTPFPTNQETTQFLSFGNMLLNNGGEIGFHGYNHMPLCLKEEDEDLQYGEYNLWETRDDMQSAMQELHRFCRQLFPNSVFSVYVPPSNILSQNGKEAIQKVWPDVRAIASSYLPSNDEAQSYVQEFDVDPDGMVNTPRIVSGLDLNDYQKITVLSELNFHYVQSHFMHPDDLLDADRGAAKGFEALSASFDKYLQWLSASAPGIRNLTGSELATAVERFDRLSVDRAYSPGKLEVKLGGFSGEAEFLMRLNAGKPTGSSGCSFERVSGNIYAVHATSETFTIYLGDDKIE